MSERKFKAVPEPRKRAVFYVRVSKDPDKDDPRFAKVSPETQIELCHQRAEQEGWKIGPTFTDINVSHADLEHRHDWAKCKESLVRDDVLVVYEQTRVSRSRSYWENFYQELKDKGVELCMLNLHLDTTTPEGEFFLSMSWGLSQLEWERQRIRILDGKNRSRESGRYQGGRIFGLMPDPEKGRGALRIVEDEAKWVRFAFEKRAEHWTKTSIAKTVRDKGVQGPGRVNKKTGELRRGPISPYVVSRWLEQPLYIGMARYPGGLYPVNVEAIVPRELWDRVQNINAESSRKGMKRGDYLLSGLCRCSKCGEVLIHHIRHNERTCWVCAMHQNPQAPRFDQVPEEDRCSGVYIEEHVLEAFVLREFFEHLDRKKLKEELQREKGRRTTDRSRVEIIYRNIETLRARQDRLLDAYADGAVGKEELARSNQKYQAEIASLEKELQEAQLIAHRARERVGSLEISDIKEAWEKMNLPAKKRVFSLFIERVVVYPGKKDNNPIVIEWRE